MKKLIGRNQLVITILAALIAVAGYLNHMEVSDKAKQNNNNVKPVTKEDTYADEVSMSDSGSEIGDTEISGNIGEAIFVSTPGTIDFVVEAKLLREETRANDKTVLMDIINNETLTEEAKLSAVQKVTELVDISEKEMAAENLILSRGFTDAIVTVTADMADVILVAEELTDSERAQIEDIVKTKTGVTADKITITAVDTVDNEDEEK